MVIIYSGYWVNNSKLEVVALLYNPGEKRM